MEKLAGLSCTEYIEKLASRDSVPGGGSASALAGAIGAALGNMVGELTVGKAKYAEGVAGFNATPALIPLSLIA